MDDSPTRPVARSTGPEIARPAPISRCAGSPAVARTEATAASIASSTASSGRSAASAKVSSARMRCPRSASTTRPVAPPMSMPTAVPAAALSVTGTPGRPTPSGAAVPPSAAMPAATRSADDGGDGAARQPGAARELGPRDGAAAAQGLQHQGAVAFAERLERAGGGGVVAHRRPGYMNELRMNRFVAARDIAGLLTNRFEAL